MRCGAKKDSRVAASSGKARREETQRRREEESWQTLLVGEWDLSSSVRNLRKERELVEVGLVATRIQREKRRSARRRQGPIPHHAMEWGVE